MKTKLLLTGAAGFIGSHILEHVLVNTDWEVICVCSWKHKGTPERLEEVLNTADKKDRVTIITHDLIAPFTAKTATRIGQVDYIVNVASESHVDRSITDPVPFVQNNVNLALNMLEFARNQTALKCFLQVSTDEVYGVAPEGVNHKEWAPIIPSNPYSASKAAQEAIAISYWRTYGVPVVITNTMNNFGEMQDPEKYVAQLVRKIYNGEVVTVHGSSEKIGSRYYLHARNHADAILFILKNLKPNLYKENTDLIPDRYNVVGDIELDNLQVANRVAKCLNKDFKYVLDDFHALRPGHDRRYALDGNKLKELGWVAPFNFDTSLQKYVNWTLKHKQWL